MSHDHHNLERARPSRRGLMLSALLVITLVAGFATTTQHLAHSADSDGLKPRSVVLLIGDGFGPSQVTLARHFAQRPLILDGMPVTGRALTASLTGPVTDSAAATTALASGTRTNNRVIGLDADGHELETIFDQAHGRGLSTGVVTNMRLTHATPACFYAHARHRQQEKLIASQLLTSTLDVALGGGSRYFTDEMREEAAQAGFHLVTERHDLTQARGSETRLLGLFTPGHMSYTIDLPTDDARREPTLAEMTAAALDHLAQLGKPFMLMVEGGRIDHAGHRHDATSTAQEGLAFDDTVSLVLDFARNAEDVLVVVTADHATGGLALTEHLDIAAMRQVTASAQHVVDTALEDAGKDASPDEVGKHIWSLAKEHLGCTLTPANLKLVLAESSARAKATVVGHIASLGLGAIYIPLQEQDRQLTGGHDGADVPVWAWGPGASAFSGTYQNTGIPKRIAAALGLAKQADQESTTR